MRLFRSVRWVLMALLLSLVPASSYAGVFISVGFAPPVMPVYEQPPCPEPGWMWTPGYWAYGDDGYYWVPGTWVPAPYEGALWTPGYWGWSSGLFVFHDGYWGPHVGYYGGVNYGFGYMGVGFAGGMWRGHDFVYNTAVMRVNTTVIHNTYIDRTVVEHNTIVNNNRVAFSGGPGGINHAPTPAERTAMSERHVAPTSFQAQHVQAARVDHSSYFKNNGGRPANVAVARPLGAGNHPAVSGGRPGQPGGFNNNHVNPSNGAQNRPAFQNNRAAQPANPGYQNRAQPQYQERNNQNRAPAQPQYQERNQSRPAPESRPAPQSRPAPESRPAPQAHPAPQARPEHESKEPKR